MVNYHNFLSLLKLLYHRSGEAASRSEVSALPMRCICYANVMFCANAQSDVMRSCSRAVGVHHRPSVDITHKVRITFPKGTHRFQRKTHPKGCVFLWRCHPDLNRGITVLQTVALPLGYDTIILFAFQPVYYNRPFLVCQGFFALFFMKHRLTAI